MLIELKDVSFRYQTKSILNLCNINLHIGKGEFVVITGKSGCGKTTLSKCINGLIPHFHEGELTGKIFIKSRDNSQLALHEIGQHIGSVFQDPRSQFFTTTTTDEVSFGCRNMGLPLAENEKRVNTAFHFFEIENLRDRSIFKLSSGEKQKIAIASCRAMRPNVYLLDEPSANLDIASTFQLAESLRKLKESGATVVVIEHRLHYLKDLADKLIYMKDGAICEAYSKKELQTLDNQRLLERGLRYFDLENMPCRRTHEIPKDQNISLQIEDVAFKYSKNRTTREVLSRVSLSACGGEIIGVTGKNGAGKTTFAKVIMGLMNQSKGTISINGASAGSKDRLKASYFVMQDSDYQLFADSVHTELILGNEKVENLMQKCDSTISALDLSEHMETHPAALSRGQKQRLTIACGLISGSKILIFDEPTSGLDACNMNQVTDLLVDAAKSGKLIFVISHDYEFLINTCTRIVSLDDGKIAEDFSMNQENQKKLYSIMIAGAKDGR